MSHYRKIWIDHYGHIPVDENGVTYEIHHIDGNKKNNSIENLKCVSIREHYDIHYKQGDWLAASMIAERLNLTKQERLFINSKISEIKKGKKHSWGEKISTANKGKMHSEEAKRKMSKAKKGKPGRAQSEESRRKITEALKKRIRKPVSEETRQKMREARLGKSSGMKGKVISEETRKKKSEIMKLLWQDPNFGRNKT